MNWWDKGSARRNVCSVVDFFRPFLSWKPIEIVPYVIPRCIIECSYQVFEHNAPSLSLSFFFFVFFFPTLLLLFLTDFTTLGFFCMFSISSLSCLHFPALPLSSPHLFVCVCCPWIGFVVFFPLTGAWIRTFNLKKKNSVKEYLRF